MGNKTRPERPEENVNPRKMEKGICKTKLRIARLIKRNFLIARLKIGAPKYPNPEDLKNAVLFSEMTEFILNGLCFSAALKPDIRNPGYNEFHQFTSGQFNFGIGYDKGQTFMHLQLDTNDGRRYEFSLDILIEGMTGRKDIYIPVITGNQCSTDADAFPAFLDDLAGPKQQKIVALFEELREKRVSRMFPSIN